MLCLIEPLMIHQQAVCVCWCCIIYFQLESLENILELANVSNLNILDLNKLDNLPLQPLNSNTVLAFVCIN